MILDLGYFSDNHKGRHCSIIIDGNCAVSNCIEVNTSNRSVTYYPSCQDGIVGTAIIESIFPRNCSVIVDGEFIGGWHERN